MQDIYISSLLDWNLWLKKNHRKEDKVALILYKKHTGKPIFTHRELMCEAICFGWIDTMIKRIDEDRFIRHFSKRNRRSRWSNNTIRYAQELIKSRRIRAQGLKFYKLGLQRPRV